MSNIKLSANNKQSGKTVYTSAIVQNIVEIAVAEVEGAMPIQDKKKGVCCAACRSNFNVCGNDGLELYCNSDTYGHTKSCSHSVYAVYSFL